MNNEPVIDSNSIGDPSLFVSFEELKRRFAALPDAPKDKGRVALIMRNGEGGRRETLDSVFVTPQAGIPGDAWGRKTNPKPDSQLAVMRIDLAEMIANGQPLGLFGDNLFLDLDLSSDNLPVGSRILVGEALMEVTPEAHVGCGKFTKRFGIGATQFQAQKELKTSNLRGIYLKVIEEGAIKTGDQVEVLGRGGKNFPK